MTIRSCGATSKYVTRNHKIYQLKHFLTGVVCYVFIVTLPHHQPAGLAVTTVASNLDVPWDITWGPGNSIWFTEQKGLVRKLNPLTGEVKTLLRLSDSHMQRAVGLLGIAFHPHFNESPLVYLDYSYLRNRDIFIKLVSYRYQNDTLTNPQILIDSIPATETHNGSRLVIDENEKILMTTGDIDIPELAQSLSSPNGKILRLNLDGSIPEDNPVAGNLAWSWGHRNAQGLVHGSNGIIYSSEHGDAQDDEINIIEKGGNYGWPAVEGHCDIQNEMAFCKDSSVHEPIFTWTPTIAPSGLSYYGSTKIPEFENSLLQTTLKDASLHVLKLNAQGTKVIGDKRYFAKQYGRLRDVCVSPEGDVYIATSNRDWNKTTGSGFPETSDDRIIRITASVTNTNIGNVNGRNTTTPTTGEQLYTQYCSSCHKTDGRGIENIFPSLTQSTFVNGRKSDLRNIVLNGYSGKASDGKSYTQKMPAFNFLSSREVDLLIEYVRQRFSGRSKK